MPDHGKSSRIGRVALLGFLAAALAGCGDSPRSLSEIGRGLFAGFGQGRTQEVNPPANPTAGTPPPVRVLAPGARRGLFGSSRAPQDPGAGVNAYLWAASLDVLGFLPITSADPFTGTIRTGYGTPPGGGRAYRAEVRIDGPALDASTLKLALYTRAGPAPAATTAALADAIYARARQLRSAR